MTEIVNFRCKNRECLINSRITLKQHILRLYAEGKTQKQIAGLTGYSRGNIGKICRTAGVNYVWTEENRKKISLRMRAMYAKKRAEKANENPKEV